MTKEEKQLLLRDICARLPYGVKVHATVDGDNTLLGVYNDRVFTTCEENDKHNDYPVEYIKPYLRRMSSMTEEEKTEFEKGYDTLLENLKNGMPGFNADAEVTAFHADFYNSHHLDFRGLIPMGLALESPEGMYKTE